eukprot:XP_001693834.1 predicted protein [Chlamydomonas reinhardtii]
MHVLWYYHFSAFRRKRWAAFIQRDRALYRVAKHFTDGRPQAQLLRERYAKHVFIIDEYKTSKTCYNCGCQEMAIKRLGGLKEGQRPWSVKVCNDCLTTWNRDVSAAKKWRAV